MSACSYATLKNYNSPACGTLASAKSAEATSGYYVVPSYSAPGYQALTHGGKDSNTNCQGANGFFNITKAYGEKAGACNQQYHKSVCQ
jgi:hypothetical protein